MMSVIYCPECLSRVTQPDMVARGDHVYHAECDPEADRCEVCHELSPETHEECIWEVEMARLEEHLKKVSGDALLPIMQGVLMAVWERGIVDTAKMLALTRSDIEWMFEKFCGPMFDAIEDQLR